MTFKLRPDQIADAERFLAEPTHAGLNASTVGAGKTATAVQAVLDSGARSTLILAPLNTLDGWQRAFRLQGDREVEFLSSKKPERMADLVAGKPGVRFIGWEWARSMNLDDIPVDFAILDEAHRAQLAKSVKKGKQTDSNRLAMGLALGTRDRGGWAMGLSATPYGNKVAGAFGICHALWGERRDLAYHAFWPFVEKYLGKTTDQRGSFVPREMERYPGLIADTMPLYWRHEQGIQCCQFHPNGIQDDLPPRVLHRVLVPLTATQRKLYDEVNENEFAWTDDSDVPIETGGFAMVKQIRLRQICLAQPTPELKMRLKDGKEEDYVQMAYPVGCTSSKIDALREIVSDLPEGERVVVFTHSSGIIPAVVAALDKQLGEGAAFGWRGGVSHAERAKAKESFLNGGRVQVLVGQVGALSEGVDMLQHVAATEVWLSMDSNGILNTQARGRLSRDGQKRTVNVYSIEAEHTIEQGQIARLEYLANNMHAALSRR